MNYAKINLFDVANGTGIRVSLFVSGCKFNCEGCFNQEAHSFSYGKPFGAKEYEMILERLSDNRFDGLSILGGDPMWQSKEDIDLLISLCKSVHELGKNVWLWTGFNFEDLNSKQLELVRNCDVVIDGRFELDKKDLSLAFRGSSNQRILHIKSN